MPHLSGNDTWLDYPNTSTLITAGKLENIESALDALLNPPVFSAYQSTAQSVASTAFTPITFTAEAYDSHNAHSTSTNTSRWVCPKDGVYLPVGGVTFLLATTGRLAAKFTLNGVDINGSYYVGAANGSGGDGSAVPSQVAVPCFAGDYIELVGFQSSGAARNTHPPGTGFGVYWLGSR